MTESGLQGMAYIRDRYGVPAKRGMRVQGYLPPRGGYGWQLATDSRITSAGSGYLFLNGGGPYHPTYNLVYLDKDGTVLCDTRESEEVKRAKRLADKVWRTNDGRETPVAELRDCHLWAALTMMQRKRELLRWKREPPIPRSAEEKMLMEEYEKRREEQSDG